MGGPGSGKGTVCSRLVALFGLVHLSIGDLLRSEVALGSEIGLHVESLMRAGDLVSDQLILDLVQRAVSNRSDSQVFLLDGFPRTLEQAIRFEQLAQTLPALVLWLSCEDSILVERLLERGKSSGRADDNEDSIRKRIETYRVMTLPIYEHSVQQKCLIEIDAGQSIDQVAFQAESALLNCLESLGGSFEG